MPDTPAFVVNDRRKFTAEGELRHENTAAESAGQGAVGSATSGEISVDSEAKGPQAVSSAELTELTDLPESAAVTEMRREPFSQDDAAGLSGMDELGDDALPPGPTEEQIFEATRAYDATVDRLDTALRSADPGGERMPEMSFERLTQSLYTQALMMLGGATQPGETPRVDILGARQTIDMISVIAEKTKGNLSLDEDKLLQSALFDLRMGFLEITQALARQAAQRQGGGPGAAMPGAGPRIVR